MGRICPNDLLIDKHHNSFGSFEFHWFPKQCGHTEGFLRWVFRGAVHSTVYHACAGFLMTLTAQKFPHLRFRRKSRTKRGLGDPSSEGVVLLARRARFLSYVHSRLQRDLAQKVVQRTCEEDLAHDLLQRSLQRELAKSTWYVLFQRPP